jgi:hypothetical protein
MRVKDPAEEEPCGQHTAYEPMCKTCCRITDLKDVLRELILRASDPDLRYEAGARFMLQEAVEDAALVIDKAKP